MNKLLLAEKEGEVVELIDGEPVISLESALRFLHKVDQIFPEWQVYLSYGSCVLSTSQVAYSQYSQLIKKSLGIDAECEVSDMSEELRARYDAYTFEGIPQFEFWYKPVPCPDAMRRQYPEGSYARHYLELELTLVRVEVKKALKIIFNRAFLPELLGDGAEDTAQLALFRSQFVAAMRMMGIDYEPIRICEMEMDHQGNVVVRSLVTGA